MGDTARRSVGNRRERPEGASMRVPRGKRARWETPGRVGRCRIPKRNQPHKCGVDFFLARQCVQLPGCLRASATLYLARFFPMRAQWNRSLPPPVAETGRRSVGNRRERPEGATMRVPRVDTAWGKTPGRELLPGHLQPSATLYLVRFPIARRRWDRSRARPVGDTARRGVGNRRERPEGATMRVLRGKRARWETPAGNLTWSCGAQQIRKRSREMNALY